MLEAGLLLLLIPWSTFWDRNYFVEMIPSARSILTSNYVRGAVSGLGILNLVAALGELADTFGRRNHVPEDGGEPG
jgi:hypothetical protein